MTLSSSDTVLAVSRLSWRCVTRWRRSTGWRRIRKVNTPVIFCPARPVGATIVQPRGTRSILTLSSSDVVLAISRLRWSFVARWRGSTGWRRIRKVNKPVILCPARPVGVTIVQPRGTFCSDER